MDINNLIQDNKQFFEWVNTPIEFTAEELQGIMNSDEPFTEEELKDIIDTELKKHYKEINTDIIDVCVSAILTAEKEKKSP